MTLKRELRSGKTTKTLKTSIIRGELDREHQFLGIVRKKLYIAHDIHKN